MAEVTTNDGRSVIRREIRRFAHGKTGTQRTRNVRRIPDNRAQKTSPAFFCQARTLSLVSQEQEKVIATMNGCPALLTAPSLTAA